VQLYQRRVTSLPLVGGQAQGVISGAGALTLSVGPAGAGNVWYPASATIQTTTGVNDFSTCQIFLGPAGLGVTLLATLFPGGIGTASLAIPSMTPGQYIIATWAGAHAGDVATVNVVGTMDSVSP
jgi:L-aminopeptidase/D-esterase-like protein